ncbi:TPA: EpsG family protein [Enterobacter hormaechei]|nr:EpsG family protein [Enterobacter hormaechei]HEM8124100.1 EpsG family protein [Enterobacter hormaechei]
MLILTNNVILLIFIIYICLIFFSALGVKLNSRGIDNFTGFMSVLLFAMLIFSRTGLGVDESTYLESYQNYLKTGDLDFEYGVNFLFLCLKTLGVNEASFNTMLPLIILAVLYFTVNTAVKNPFRSFVLIFTMFSSLFLDFSFNAYRQGLSFWFVLLSIESLLAGSRKRFLIYFIIGLGFHWSAAIVIVMLFLTRFLSIRGAIYTNVILMFVMLIAAVTPLHILSMLATIIQYATFNSLYAQKIIFYLTTIKSSFYDLNFFGRAPLILYSLILMALLFLYRKYIPRLQFKLLVILLGYSILLLEMSYSFRNFYWVLPFTPFIMARIMGYYVTRKKLMLIFTSFSLGLWALSIAGFFSFPILFMIFQ